MENFTCKKRERRKPSSEMGMDARGVFRRVFPRFCWDLESVGRRNHPLRERQMILRRDCQ